MIKRDKILTLVLCTSSMAITACASSPEATGEMAQAVSTASNAVQADSVEEVLTQNINIPMYYMLLFGGACTFVPNPFQLVGKAITTVANGAKGIIGIFK